MSPTIHLVRHGEAEHNVSFNCQIRDPGLTEVGGAQCRMLGNDFPYMDRVTHLVASPLRRTVQTAYWAFLVPLWTSDDDEKQEHRTILALGELQECSRHPCDIGLSVEELTQCAEHLDLSRVDPNWNSKSGLYAPSEPAIRMRAERARVILRELAAKASKGGDDRDDDVHIVVVSHGTMIQYLTERPDARKSHFHNCEYRSYKFVDLYGDDPKTAGLVETNESFYRRYGPLNMRSSQEADDLLAADGWPRQR
ncbi:histidine phosphatase superfamily [Apiospora sp. TS-2023a]